jgi:hypothetical protein
VENSFSDGRKFLWFPSLILLAIESSQQF